MMNKVVNALNGPLHQRLLAGAARRGLSNRPAPGRALRLPAVFPCSSRIFPLDYSAAPALDPYSQVVDNQQSDLLAIFVPRKPGRHGRRVETHDSFSIQKLVVVILDSGAALWGSAIIPPSTDRRLHPGHFLQFQETPWPRTALLRTWPPQAAWYVCGRSCCRIRGRKRRPL